MGGCAGLFVLQLLVTCGAFVFVFLNIRRNAPGLKWLAPALLFLVYAAAHSRLFIRPHLFEFFFVSLYLYLLGLNESTGRTRYIYALFPLQALWINIHSSSILGLFIVGAYALGSAIDGFRGKGLRDSITVAKSSWKLIIVAALLPVASLLNPYGYKLLVWPLIHQGNANADALRHIGEWRGPGSGAFSSFIRSQPGFGFKALFFSSALASFTT